tara:strand:- start:8758 stop:9381 length:624 start_codon:yes stop_codon:yes gene_type:complete
MNITKRKVSELVEDSNNSRAHDGRNISAIEKSLEEFGQQKPIVITKENKVIAGNGTLVAAMQLGWQEIDVVVTTLTAAKQAGFAIADNRTGELSAWDNESLANTMAELSKDGFDMDALGFNKGEIDQMLSTLSDLEVTPTETSDFPYGFNKSKEEYENNTIKTIQLFFDIKKYGKVVDALETEKTKRGMESYPDVMIALLNEIGYGI